MNQETNNPIPVPDPNKSTIKCLYLALMEHYFFHYSTWIRPGDKYQAGDYIQ